MSDTTSKGDRLFAGLQGSKPASNAVAESGKAGGNAGLDNAGLDNAGWDNASWDEALLEQVSGQMAARQMETQQLREAMLATGVSEEIVNDPEGAEMEHLDENEQEQFNDAVREHRAFRQELEHDMRELQRSRDAAGIRHDAADIRHDAVDIRHDAVPPTRTEGGS